MKTTELTFTMGDIHCGFLDICVAEINVSGIDGAYIACAASDAVAAKSLREIVLCRLIGYPLEQARVARLEAENTALRRQHGADIGTSDDWPPYGETPSTNGDRP